MSSCHYPSVNFDLAVHLQICQTYQYSNYNIMVLLYKDFFYREMNEVGKQAAVIVPGMRSHTTAKEKYERASNYTFYSLPQEMVDCPQEAVWRLSSNIFQVSVQLIPSNR